MKTDEIRERFQKFYEARGHARYPSDSLVPSNDPSLLFTSAGMAQFKDMFLGIGKLPHRRITNCQRCLRVGDLENVGRTARHHTFFEMLGNFSFGDYFKEEAIPWCWEFYNQELGIPAERLWASIYEKDDEAERIWKKLGKLKNPVVKMGEADNFWPANAPSQGPNGPCGPCSELYYDFGAERGCGKPGCAPGCSCDRFVEIGNIVFTQYERQEGGVLKPLPQRNIDFGGGLERVAAVMQGVHSNYDIDIFVAIRKAILSAFPKSAKVNPENPEIARRIRRISDHIRALTFCIADGAMPGRDGRGYVVRRILRTAYRDYVKILSFAPERLPTHTFLHGLIPTVVKQMGGAHPIGKPMESSIETVIRAEEEQFQNTLQRGLDLIKERIEALKAKGERVLPGVEAFLLYQSFGFPIELTVDEVGSWPGFSVDIEGFNRALQKTQEGSRTAETIFDPNSPLTKVKEKKVPTTDFLGYGIRVADLAKAVPVRILHIVKLDPESLARFAESKKDMAQVTKLISKGALVDVANQGDPVAVLCDKTPFYADGGGQVGDAGWFEVSGGEVEVTDTRKPDGYYFHLGHVSKGSIRPGPAEAQINADRRLDIMRNHTGTHLLHAALRAVLGTHVTQAGSVVEPDRLRFDFQHPRPLTQFEKEGIEDWVNTVIFADLEVTKEELTMEEAKARGALMFFGDKYGDRVRVVTVGPAKSVELCGGTHLEHASTIGQFRITSEGAIGSGVRRIEAVTGRGAVALSRKQEYLLVDLARELQVPVADLPRRLKQIAKDVQELKSEVGRLRRGGGGSNGVDALMNEAKAVGVEKVVAARLESGQVDDARALMDELTKKRKVGAAILAVPGERPAFVIGVREDLVKAKGLKAGDLAKEVGKACGGGGGGRELQAQAGASDASKIQLGFDTFEAAVRAKLE